METIRRSGLLLLNQFWSGTMGMSDRWGTTSMTMSTVAMSSWDTMSRNTVSRNTTSIAELVVVRQFTTCCVKGGLVGLHALVALWTFLSVTSALLFKGTSAVATNMRFTELVVVTVGATSGLQSISVADNTLEAVVVLAGVGSTVPGESRFTAVALVTTSTVGVEVLSGASSGGDVGVVGEETLVASGTLTLLHTADSGHCLVASHGGWWVGNSTLVTELLFTEEVATGITEHRGVLVSAVDAHGALMLKVSANLCQSGTTVVGGVLTTAVGLDCMVGATSGVKFGTL